MPRFLVVIAVGLALVACGSPAAGPSAEKSLILATTTGTQDSGLLDELLPAFTTDTGWQVKTLAVGSGQALELGRRGEADVLLVHSPAAEQKFVAEGKAGQRRLVMHNDFVLVGPAADPAGIERNQQCAGDAGRSRPRSRVRLPRRRLGHQRKEKDMWAKAGIAPGGAWYQSTGQGMGETLRVASRRAATRCPTAPRILAQRETLGLQMLGEGDPGLLNVYHVIEMTRRPEAGAARRGEGVRRLAGLAADPAADR